MDTGIEIMSPAGNFTCFTAALQAGANSIYFGIEQLNMRARAANNFTFDDLKKIGKLAKENNVRTYLTLNTIIYDHDISLMKRIVNKVKENDITAIIASDQAVINYAHTQGVEVHISTQANITNIETIKFFSHFADVMVLSRELSLNQVRQITESIKKENITGPSGKIVQIEIFVHGALCMAVSGKCYLSLHTKNSSANRGACIQNCRRTYTVKDKEEGFEFDIDNEYIMSPKDLCTIGFVDDIINSGVKVFKIEGRGRSPEYVYNVTKCYKEAVKSVFENTYNQKKIDIWKSELDKVYNRGFWDGYYLGQKVGEWSKVYGSQAKQKKIYIGKGVKYFTDIKVAEFSLESQFLSQGDNILVMGPTTGVINHKVQEIRVNKKRVKIGKKGESISIPFPKFIRPSDKMYKVIDL